MKSLARNGLTAEQVRKTLITAYGSNNVTVKYNLLDNQNRVKGTVSSALVTGGSVTHEALADVKRKARFSLVKDDAVNLDSDRIQPVVQVTVDTQTSASISTTAEWEAGTGTFVNLST